MGYAVDRVMMLRIIVLESHGLMVFFQTVKFYGIFLSGFCIFEQIFNSNIESSPSLAFRNI